MTALPLRRAAVALVSVAALASSAAAQEDPGSAYLVGGLTLPHQEGLSGEAAHQTYVSAPGGTTAGWLLGAGVFISRWVSIEGEGASTGIMEARQPSRHGMTFNEERRERFFSLNIRAHLGGRRLHLEPVLGITLVRATAWSQTEHERLTPSGSLRTEIDRRVETVLPSGPAVSFGLDARLGGRRIAVVPSFRVRLARRADEFTRTYPGGFPRWTVSPGVMARVDF